MTEPNLSLCQLAMLDTTLEDDIAIARSVGASGLGVIEMKLSADPARDAEMLRSGGIAASVCATNVLSILPPGRQDWFPGPADEEARLAEMLAGLERLAALRPDSVFCLTGPVGELEPREARARVVESLRVLADAAKTMATRIAIEPMREPLRGLWTMVCSLAETIDLLDEVGRDNLGIVFDTWHLWDSPEVHSLIPHVVDRIFDVQISDYREPPRGPQDRLIAGDGAAGIDVLVGELLDAGYRGWFDMELFSDDGRFGNDYPDSLWKLPPDEFAALQIEGFRRCWDAGRLRAARTDG